MRASVRDQYRNGARGAPNRGAPRGGCAAAEPAPLDDALEASEAWDAIERQIACGHLALEFELSGAADALG